MNVLQSVEQEAVSSTQVLRQFRIIFNAIKTHFRQIEKEVGMGGAQVWALSLIRDHPSITMNEIAEKMDIHQSTASNLIKSLVQKGCVKQERSTADRRSVLLTIESAGLRILAQIPGPFEGLLPDALRSLSPETLARLNLDLGQIIRLLDVDDAAARTPLAQI
jgi:DNA-binding MarR family transcriptional regulator